MKDGKNVFCLLIIYNEIYIVYDILKENIFLMILNLYKY